MLAEPSISPFAQNVMDYYMTQRDKLRRGVQSYSEAQGKGFVCWRFLMNQAVKAAQAAAAAAAGEGEGGVRPRQA